MTKSSLFKPLQNEFGRIQDNLKCANKERLDNCIFKILLVLILPNLISISSTGGRDIEFSQNTPKVRKKNLLLT